MRAIVCGFLMVLIACCATVSCAQAPAEQAGDFRFGDWWGGFGLMDGDRLHWTHFSATLRNDGKRVAGQGLYLVGPEQHRLTDKTIGISGKFRDAGIRLRLSYGGKRVDCEARYSAEYVVGTCKVAGEEVTLRLVRVESFDPAEPDALRAVYEIDADHRILIGQTGPMLSMLDLPSGQLRILFPKGDATWVAGPRLIVGYPEEWRLRFTEDGLTVQRDGEAPLVGKRRPGMTEEAFSFASERDDVTLRGTLSLPVGPGPHPAVVWVHGSGQTPRGEAMFFPEYLTDLGLAVLAFDKRGVGESGGSYAMADGATFNVPFLRRRAADVVSAMNALRDHPRVDGKRIGLFGISQAGWVIPVAASSTECAFTITLGGGATRLSQEDYYSQLTDEGSSDAALRTVDDALAMVRERTPRGHDWSVDFASQRCPGLWLYGLRDRSNPSQLCVEVIEAVKAEHDKDFTVVQFPTGNHPLMESRVGGSAERLVLSRFVPGMFTTIEDWLAEKGFVP